MKTGQQLRSIVCSGKVIVLRAPKEQSAVLCCGGQPMVGADSDAAIDKQLADPDLLGGTAMGKRYTELESGIQILCVSTAEGTLTIDNRPLELEAAKQLPSSD